MNPFLRFLAYLLIVLFSATIMAGTLTAAPIAKEGILDVRSWDVEKDGPIGLDGQWEFYWKQLFFPDDFDTTGKRQLTGYIEAPGYWDGYRIEDQVLDGIGYATFRLRIIHLPADQQIAFEIPLMHTAYRLWANGRRLSLNGEVGRSRQLSEPEYIPKYPVLVGTPDEIELVLQISNFHHNNGGIWQTLRMGSAEQIAHKAQRQTAFDLFLLGAILIMALYHFALYALRPKEVSPLFFGLFCLIVSFRISLHGSTIFSVLFPQASWEVLVKLDYFTLYFGLSYYCAFIYSLYRPEFSRRILNVIVALAAAFVLFTIVTPATVYTAYLVYFQAIMGISCLYTLFVLVLASIRKREGAKVVLGGCVILIITLVNDILYNHEVIHTGDIVGFGLFIMIFSQSYVLSSKFSKAFQLVEDLSIHLDQLVRERTAAIKDLLDNTGQGFFSFSSDYKVQPFTSKATHDFFGKSIEDEDAVQLMFSDTAGDKKKLFNLLFEETGNLDLIEGILPSEVKRDGRIYKVDYHWIDAREDVEGRVMIVMTDITTQRKLEQQLRIDEERNRMIVKIAVDRHGFIDFLHEVNHCLEQVDRILDSPPAEIKVEELFRHFHTIKGGMASYFFADVAEKAHNIENLLEAVRTDDALPTEDLLNSVKKETDELRQILKATLEGLEEIVPKQLIEAGFQPYFRIAESKIAALESALGDQMQSNPEIENAVKNLKRQPIRNIMKKFASDAENLAQNLGKAIDISINGENTEIVHAAYKPMLSSLIHIIRNCVDHGLETPEIRMASGKPEQGSLKISVDTHASELFITIEDDGAGIDAGVIKTKALEMGLISTSQSESMSDDEAIRLIFSSGFSTNDMVTDLSGRGVGMDAVAEEIAGLNGTIDVQTTLGKGTRFQIRVPQI